MSARDHSSVRTLGHLTLTRDTCVIKVGGTRVHKIFHPFSYVLVFICSAKLCNYHRTWLINFKILCYARNNTSGNRNSFVFKTVILPINDIILTISWISSKEIVRFTGFTNIHYFSGTPILHKDILEISFPIPPTMSFYVGY